MKSIFLLLLGASLMSMIGCASLAPFMGIKEMTMPPVPLEITSSPSGADVFLNDKLVGKTPCTVPLSLTLDTATWEPKMLYVIRVAKEGYRDAAKPVEIRRETNAFGESKGGLSGLEVVGKYHFELEKKDKE